MGRSPVIRGQRLEALAPGYDLFGRVRPAVACHPLKDGLVIMSLEYRPFKSRRINAGEFQKTTVEGKKTVCRIRQSEEIGMILRGKEP